MSFYKDLAIDMAYCIPGVIDSAGWIDCLPAPISDVVIVCPSA